MRTMRTLGTLVVIGGTVVVAYGCSAAGNAPISTDAADGSTTTPPADYGSAGDSGSSSGGSTPKTDAGTTGGGYVYDAGSVALAPEGSPCDPTTALGDPQSTEACGLCGTQTRACLSNPDGGTGSVWGIWGTCTGAVTSADACDPSKTYTSTACGNCGTTPQVCGSDCHFETGFDCTEPSGACHPTDTEFVLGASCTTAGQGRVYTCGATCTYGSPGACQAPPPNPNTLTLSATVGGTVNGVFSLPASPLLPAISSAAFDDTCPATVDTDPDDETSGVYVAIVNPTSRSINVSLWDGPAASGSANNFDTVMAWYNTPVFPPPDLTACGFFNDDCGSASSECLNTSGFSYWSALTGTEGPVIPAGGTVTVFISMLDTGIHGNVKLYAKSED
jgi:hypothetical protein